jgi:hypothetical protein
MPRTVWVHSGGGRQAIRLLDVPDDALVQDVKELIWDERTGTGKSMGFNVGDWALSLANEAHTRDGAFLAADQPVAPAGAGVVLHVWVERVVAPAAGEPFAGPGCRARVGALRVLGWADVSHDAVSHR